MPFSHINLASYVENVSQTINRLSKPAVLVGHSMARVISQVAEVVPEKIDSLIYIAAFIPTMNGTLWNEARG